VADETVTKQSRQTADARRRQRGASGARTVVLAFAALVLAGCGTFSVPQPEPPQQPAAPTVGPAQQITDRLGRTENPNAVKVALLVPLSGRGSEIGPALQNAAEMAVLEAGARNFELLPRDTGGTAQGAAAAARAVLEEGADLIVGPLFSESVRPVGQAAAAQGVNVIAFTTDASVAGDNVLVMGFVPGDQVDRIVGYGVSRGLNRFALLAPGTPYGQTVGDALREATARHGAELIATELYQSGGREFSAPVQRLAQQADSIDAVMLPDAGLRLRTIAPLLPYYNMDTIQILGTGLWDGQAVGAEPTLVGAWFAAPDPDLRADFVRDYRENFGQAPPRLATLAYDAVSLAAFLARSRDGDAYAMRSLTDPSGFIGADGIFRFGPDGVAERGLAVLEVTPGGAEVRDPAPASFAVAGF
jgi:ABC-type branched-subunit amino acid transport system substrate-binding protein